MTVFPTGYCQSVDGRELINFIAKMIGMDTNSNRIPEQEVMIILFMVNHFSTVEMLVIMLSRFGDLTKTALRETYVLVSCYLLFATQRPALPAAGENQAWKRKTVIAQKKPKNRADSHQSSAPWNDGASFVTKETVQQKYTPNGQV
jgi:hypothetical protein